MFDVLVPIDQDDGRARAQIESVAALPDATESVRARLLHVFEDRERAEETSVRQLTTGSSAYDLLNEKGITTVTSTAYGDPAEEILRVAEEEDVDTIVLGGRKRTQIGSLLFGSVSQAVSLDADRPVTITGSRKQTERDRTAEEQRPPNA